MPAMAFVMDPLEQADPQADTTFALIMEAQARGFACYICAQHNITVQPQKGVVARAQLAPALQPNVQAAMAAPMEEIALDEMQLVWQRSDPPVNETYVRATQMLSLCRRATVLNRPQAIISANEKLFALHFPQLMPPTLVTRSMKALAEFRAAHGGQMIVKPLDGRGGEGVFHLRAGDPNARTILEGATNFEQNWTMAQAYLPEVRAGDKRILLVDGAPLGAVLRVPAAEEARANFHSGGRAEAAVLDAADKGIVAALAPRLREEGLFFVGIDVIGGKLTEINVTSPTGIQEMSRLDNVNYAARVIDAALAKANL